ncbi:hypothetical protein Ae201684P_015519 [Aphanomyces euteiches]|nr:hypothetical protein Ae201684P_015519 [Aphanomyces euteiches]
MELSTVDLPLKQDIAKYAEPPLKKAKLTQLDVVFQGPVGAEFYSVPMETIPVYGKLIWKTTIGYRIQQLLAVDSSVLVIYHSASENSVKTEKAFWMALGKICGKDASTPEDVMDIVIRRKQRLFLILDEMDAMFANRDLTSNFMDILRGWMTSPYFRGFLGIGSYDLVSLYKYHKGSDRVSPFNLCAIFKTERFSADQMISFFKLIEPRYSFTDSTRIAIMDYSGGAPGVFGSLIRFSIDNCKWTVERHKWESWLKITAFTEYLDKYNWTYSRIRDDLKEMSAETWKTLQTLLMNGASIHRSVVGADALLRMGITIEATDSTVVFSSEMMRRVCLEALPIRDIKQVVSSENPLELFAASLQFLKPGTITHYLVTNRQCPSEAVFQFELYSSIRGILASNNASRHILAEAGERDDRRRLDIIICNGVKYGFELKSNQLTATNITAAVSQANGYRTLLAIDKMFMVNFVPQSHSMDEIYQVDEFPHVQIIHVRFPESCTEYEICIKNQMELSVVVM